MEHLVLESSLPYRPLRPRILWPREHGAYGQLALPLVTALAVGRPGWASFSLVSAAVTLFVAHESLLVVLGARGVRARRDHGRQARTTGFGLAVLALGGGSLGLWLGGPSVLVVSLLPLGLLALLVPVVLRGLEKSLGGEILVALALSAAAAPVATAGGLEVPDTLLLWATWAGALVVSACAVRWVISSHRGRRDHASLAAAFVAVLVALGYAAVAPGRGLRLLLAASPLLLASGVLFFRPPDARRIRRVGWSIIGAGGATAVLLVVWLRPTA